MKTTKRISLVRFDQPEEGIGCFGPDSFKFYKDNKLQLDNIMTRPGTYEIRITERAFGLIQTFNVIFEPFV